MKELHKLIARKKLPESLVSNGLIKAGSSNMILNTQIKKNLRQIKLQTKQEEEVGMCNMLQYHCVFFWL